MEYRSELLSFFGKAFEIFKALTEEVLSQGGKDEDFKRILTNPDLRTRLAGVIMEDQASPIIETLTTSTDFDYDKRNDGWILLEDVNEPVDFEVSVTFSVPLRGKTASLKVSSLELVSFFEPSENQKVTIPAEVVLQRSRGEVGSRKLRGCNWGQRHGEALIRDESKMPSEWRARIIVLPGTVWEDEKGGRFVPCMAYDEGQWLIRFYRLNRGFPADYRLLHLREFDLAA